MVAKASATGTRRRLLLAAPLAAAALLAGCAGFTRVTQHGYVLQAGALEQVPVGSSREQVLLVLGTPSTTAMLGGETFYYISQTTEKTAFLPARTVDQRVLAVYFDANGRVRDIAEYGLVDGRIFDFVDRVTPSGGLELNFIAQLLGATPTPSF